MATFAVGDVHGCWDTLRRLLDRLAFEAGRDQLWLVGDLVNRGPRSLAVLRWARDTAAAMGERFAVVLGNHDLRLLALAAGVTRPKRLDTLGPVLAAEDGGELVAWLGARPFVHRDEGENGWVMVHAGFLPGWTVEDAEAAARRVEAALAGPLRSALLVRGPADPAGEDPALRPLREALAAFTLLRTLDAEGQPCHHSGPPEEAPAGCVPWFRAPGRRTADRRIVCGHWAALGFHREDGVIALDSGCVWGQGLTAVRLDDGEVFQQATVETPDELPA